MGINIRRHLKCYQFQGHLGCKKKKKKTFMVLKVRRTHKVSMIEWKLKMPKIIETLRVFKNGRTLRVSLIEKDIG